MTENELKSAADLIIQETGNDKNTGGRIGSLFKLIIDFFSKKVSDEGTARVNTDEEIRETLSVLTTNLENESTARDAADNNRMFVCNLDIFIPLESGFYTLQSAISAVTQSVAIANIVVAGFEIRFKTETGLSAYVFQGGDKYDTLNWKPNLVSVEKAERIAAEEEIRLEMLSKTIGMIHPAAEEKPAEGVSRTYRFIYDGNCNFTDVFLGDTEQTMEAPFPVRKDDELRVIYFGGLIYYRYFPITSRVESWVKNGDSALQEQINTINTDMGNISEALDLIISIGSSI